VYFVIYAICVFQIKLDACNSLKEKRSCIKSLMKKIRNRFNVSISEIDKQHIWNESVIACSLVSNDKRSSESHLAKLIKFVENNADHFYLMDHTIQFL